jgi:hypothetical protein
MKIEGTRGNKRARGTLVFLKKFGNTFSVYVECRKYFFFSSEQEIYLVVAVHSN